MALDRFLFVGTLNNHTSVEEINADICAIPDEDLKNAMEEVYAVIDLAAL